MLGCQISWTAQAIELWLKGKYFTLQNCPLSLSGNETLTHKAQAKVSREKATPNDVRSIHSPLSPWTFQQAYGAVPSLYLTTLRVQVSSRLLTGVTISSGPKSSSVIAGDVKLGREMMVGGKKPRPKVAGRRTKSDLFPLFFSPKRKRETWNVRPTSFLCRDM